MTRTEKNRCVRWRLNWLPGDKLETRSRHPTQMFTKQHAIKCLDMHHRLQMSETAQDPPSLLLNKLPNRIPCFSHSASPWFIWWTVICIILYELDYLLHNKDQPSPPFQPRQRFLDWISSSPHFFPSFFLSYLFYTWLSKGFLVSIHFLLIWSGRKRYNSRHHALKVVIHFYINKKCKRNQ